MVQIYFSKEGGKVACRCRCYLTTCFLELITEISNNMIEDICIYVADLKHVDKLYMSGPS